MAARDRGPVKPRLPLFLQFTRLDTKEIELLVKVKSQRLPVSRAQTHLVVRTPLGISFARSPLERTPPKSRNSSEPVTLRHVLIKGGGPPYLIGLLSKLA